MRTQRNPTMDVHVTSFHSLAGGCGRTSLAQLLLPHEGPAVFVDFDLTGPGVLDAPYTFPPKGGWVPLDQWILADHSDPGVFLSRAPTLGRDAWYVSASGWPQSIEDLERVSELVLQQRLEQFLLALVDHFKGNSSLSIIIDSPPRFGAASRAVASLARRLPVENLHWDLVVLCTPRIAVFAATAAWLEGVKSSRGCAVHLVMNRVQPGQLKAVVQHIGSKDLVFEWTPEEEVERLLRTGGLAGYNADGSGTTPLSRLGGIQLGLIRESARVTPFMVQEALVVLDPYVQGLIGAQHGRRRRVGY